MTDWIQIWISTRMGDVKLEARGETTVE